MRIHTYKDTFNKDRVKEKMKHLLSHNWTVIDDGGPDLYLERVGMSVATMILDERNPRHSIALVKGVRLKFRKDRVEVFVESNWYVYLTIPLMIVFVLIPLLLENPTMYLVPIGFGAYITYDHFEMRDYILKDLDWIFR